jgi:hypothetical protein
MAHDTHHDTQESQSQKTTTSFRGAFWFVIILAGLFIAAINFVTVMSHDEPEAGHGGSHGTEHTSGHGTGHEVTPPTGAHEAPGTETHHAAPADTAHAAY